MVLRGEAVSYERGTPVAASSRCTLVLFRAGELVDSTEVPRSSETAAPLGPVHWPIVGFQEQMFSIEQATYEGVDS